MKAATSLSPLHQKAAASTSPGLQTIVESNGTMPTSVMASAAMPSNAEHAAADEMAGLDEAGLSSDGARGKLSRGGSSIRSELSVGSQSPDKAAAKQQRHKVICLTTKHTLNACDTAVNTIALLKNTNFDGGC